MPGWRERLRSRLARATGGPAGRASGPDAYQGLRSIALGVDLATIQVPAGEPLRGVLVALMEIGLPGGIATVVAVADGSVSMVTSSGGGVIGAGEHAAVRDAGQRFRVAMAESRDLLVPATEFPAPEPGQVRFHARSDRGGMTAVATEESLRARRHALAPLYAAGQDVVTEIRLSTPGGGER